MTKTLYERLKPEHKTSLAIYHAGRHHSHQALIKVLSNEYYYTEVKYGDAFDITNACNLDFLGDAFNPSII